MALLIHRYDSPGLATSTDAPPVDPDGLCSKCSKLDLEAAFEKPSKLGVRDLPLKGDSIQCPLCRLFVDVGNKYPHRRIETGNRHSYTIESAEYRHVLGITDKVDRRLRELVHCLIVYPSGFGPLSYIIGEPKERNYLRCAILKSDKELVRAAYRVTHPHADIKLQAAPDSQSWSLQGRAVGRNSVDYDAVKDWLGWCYEHHPSDCFQRSEDALRNLKDNGMRLIDCNSGLMCAYELGQRYVALSYVWGFTQSDADWEPVLGEGLPDDVPVSIQDAMTVCRRLGLEYLWVDQYCINQNDAGDQEQQIALMQDIYARSWLTIYAAAGTNPHYGLPGVSVREKTGPMSAQAGDLTLVSTLRRPAWLIKWSRWGRRGWTYQEGELANRRLIFTDEQVSFECRGMHCVESIQRPLHVMSNASLRRQRNDVRPDYWRGDANPERRRAGTRGTRAKMWHHIVAFNTRDFSNEDDRLKGFSGILDKYGAYRVNSHVVGVPIDALNFGRRQPWARSARESRCGEHEVSFVAALCWHTYGIRSQKSIPNQHRRPRLPSFSWIGWTGPIGFELVRSAFGERKKGRRRDDGETKVYHSLIKVHAFRSAAEVAAITGCADVVGKVISKTISDANDYDDDDNDMNDSQLADFAAAQFKFDFNTAPLPSPVTPSIPNWRHPAFTPHTIKHGLTVTGGTMLLRLKLTVIDAKSCLLSVRYVEGPAKWQVEFAREDFRLSAPELGRMYNAARRHPDDADDGVMLRVEMEAMRLMTLERCGEASKVYLMLFRRCGDDGEIERVGLLELMRSRRLFKEMERWPVKEETLVLR